MGVESTASVVGSVEAISVCLFGCLFVWLLGSALNCRKSPLGLSRGCGCAFW